MNKIQFLRRFFSAIMLLVATTLVTSNAVAQRISTMTVSTFSGSYIPLIIDPTATTLASVGGSVYYGTYTMSLPFAFSYDATTYAAGTTVYVRWGHINFSNPLDPNYQNYVGSASYPGAIAPFMGLQVSAPDGSTRIMYKISGSSPNRVLTIEWYKFGDYPSQASGNVSYQLKLYEGSSQIEFIYEKYNFSVNYANAYYHGTGLNGNALPSFISVVNVASSFTTPASNYRFAYPLPVELSVSPKSMVYGAVQAGNSVTLCATAKHVGTGGQLIFNSGTITGSSDFSIVSSPAGPLAVGQTAQYCVKFTPTGSGLRTATLTIATNGQDSGTQSVDLNGTGLYPQIAVDSIIRFKKTRTGLGDSLTQWVHISSVGQAPLFFTGYPITGIDADQYYISHFPVNPLSPGITDSLGITYTPTREGKRVATLTIQNNSANFPSIAVSLQGTGILPHIVVTPPIVLFDSTREGDTVCKSITIWNPGSDTLRIKSNTLSSNDGDFHYTGLSGSDVNIPPDQSKTVGICFIPIQQGFRQGRILLKTNIKNTFDTPRQDTAGTISIDLRGTGVPFGVFGNSVSGLPFVDSAIVGKTVCRTDTLKNMGDADILVTGLSVSGSTAFSTSGLPSFPFILHARAAVEFTICGTPDKQGLISGVGVVTGTTGGSKITMNLPLFVYGFKVCVAPSPQTLFAGVMLPNNGSDSTVCDTVTNCGDIAAVYSATISGGSKLDYTVTPATSGMVAPGGTAVFCLQYKPTVVGSSPATLDVAAVDGSISSSIPLGAGSGCAVVTAVADAVPPAGVNGGKSTFDVTITNTGTFEWTANKELVTPNDGVFSVVSYDKPTAATGGTIVAHMSFTPVVMGNVSAILTFPNAAPCENAPISVTLNGEGVVNSVKETSSEGYSLDQSYPNPTQGATSFSYRTPGETEVRITVVDLTGNLVRTLITGRVSEGQHTVKFDARDLTSGTYVYVLESGSTRLVRQFILAK